MASTFSLFFFFNDPPPPEISPLPLHDPLPIWGGMRIRGLQERRLQDHQLPCQTCARADGTICHKSEEHTSELQSRLHLVCRLLLEKKKKQYPLLLQPCIS